MKLTTITQVSVDGVMQTPGVNLAEGDSGMSDRRGWAHFDDEAGSAMDAVFERAGAFLFGRRTYDHFASTWGTWTDPGASPIWTALHTLPKYVATRAARSATVGMSATSRRFAGHWSQPLLTGSKNKVDTTPAKPTVLRYASASATDSVTPARRFG